MADAPHRADPALFLPSRLARGWSSDKYKNFTAVALKDCINRRKKKQEEEAAAEWRETSSWGKTACVCIYWPMNQYGFSYSERAGCNGEWVSVAASWSQGTVARSPLIASRRFVRGGWMKGVTAKRYEEYKSYYSSYRRPMAMALITRSDLLYPWLRPHKHRATGRCVWSPFHVDSLDH